MNTKKYNQIIDEEVYENYLETCKRIYNEHNVKVKISPLSDKSKTFLFLNEKELLLKEEFLDRYKTDSEFSESWKLKIEGRKLNFDERCLLLFDKYKNNYDR